jgi:hypothetical protein
MQKMKEMRRVVVVAAALLGGSNIGAALKLDITDDGRSNSQFAQKPNWTT